MRIAAFFVGALALCAQPPRDPLEVLHRARARLLDTVDRLPRYTCVETVDRSYFEQPSLPSGASCQDALKAHDAGQADLHLTDRLRLDVAVANGEEIYSWAGAGRFESKRIPDLIGGGPIGTGSFGPFLISIFANPGVRIVYRGEEIVDAESLLAYGFRVPRELSHYELQARNQRRTIAYDGTFWLDPESAELRRLQVHTGRLAEDIGICEASTTVVFDRVRIGAGVYLLPRESRLQSVSTGLESENVSTYSGCREYRGESVVHFGEAESVTPSSPVAVVPIAGLPRGLRFALAFEEEIDSDSAAAGDAVGAKVLKDLTDPRSKRVLVPAGAMARGRITRLAHQLSPRPYFLVAIQFETLEWDGVAARFSAVVDPRSGPLGSFSVSVTDLRTERKAGRAAPRATPPGMEFSAGRTLVFPSTASRYVVPRGYESHWLTGGK